MMNFRYLKSLIFMILVLSTSCSDVDNKQGHIAFIHIGEEDSPVLPYILTTKFDTTYLKYKKKTEDYVFHDFTDGNGYSDRNIERIDDTCFEKFREELVALSSDTLSFGDRGSFYILVDSRGLHEFVLPAGDSATLYFDNLLQISKKHGLEKSYNRFLLYKYMQKSSMRSTIR